MCRKIYFLIPLTLANYYIFSQQLRLPPPVIGKIPQPTASYRNQDFTAQLSMIDPTTGRSFINSYPDVKGFPYFLEDWSYTLISLADGRTFDMVKARIDLYKEEVYFKTKDNVEMVLDSGSVKEIDVYESATNKQKVFKFRTGFPQINNQDQNTFYQVVCDGNVTLLKLISKKISVNKNDLSGEVERRFDVSEEYYIFRNNQMKRLKKEKDFILKNVSQKKEQIEEFVKQHSIDFKNMHDIIQLFNFYNSLFP